jgi:peptidoglycan hydrolase CwlO-like protein
MSVTSLPVRRTITLVVAVAALLLGFMAIRAASAWTAEAAPLVASPASAAAIESKLADEQSRSADLQDRLTAITGQTDDMAAAVRAAQDRIASDAAHAAQLTTDLANANRKLKALEISIKQAQAAAKARTVTVVTTTTGGSTASSGTSASTYHDDGVGGDD